MMRNPEEIQEKSLGNHSEIHAKSAEIERSAGRFMGIPGIIQGIQEEESVFLPAAGVYGKVFRSTPPAAGVYEKVLHCTP